MSRERRLSICPQWYSSILDVLRMIELTIVQYAGLTEDEPIPEGDLDAVHNLQQEFAVDIDWEIGDVLIIDVGDFVHM